MALTPLLQGLRGTMPPPALRYRNAFVLGASYVKWSEDLGEGIMVPQRSSKTLWTVGVWDVCFPSCCINKTCPIYFNPIIYCKCIWHSIVVIIYNLIQHQCQAPLTRAPCILTNLVGALQSHTRPMSPGFPLEE